MILATISVTSSTRIAEIGFALAAIAGGLIFLAAIMPAARKGLAVAAGLALAAGAVLVIIAVHWGVFGFPLGYPHR
jgi:hypothetical protein